MLDVYTVSLTQFDIHMLNEAIDRELHRLYNKLEVEADDLAAACMDERCRKLRALKIRINSAMEE